MKKEKAPVATPTPFKSDSKSKFEEVNPKIVFVNSAISMSWQLAVVVLVPILAGVWLDSHFKTAPTYTLIGFVIGIIGMAILLKKVLNEYSVKLDDKGGKK